MLLINEFDFCEISSSLGHLPCGSVLQVDSDMNEPNTPIKMLVFCSFDKNILKCACIL